MKRKWMIYGIFAVLISVHSQALSQDILQAAKTGDLERLKSLLEQNPSMVGSRDQDQNTPLHLAVDEGKIEAAKLLIDKGADVNAVNFKKETPLHIAAYEGNAEAVGLLLKYKADPKIREQRDRTALYMVTNWGSDPESTAMLIDAGAEVNDTNSRGENLFVSSLFYGKKEVIDLLIDRGAVLPEDESTLRRVLFVTASNGLERPFNMAVESCEKKQLEWWAGIPMHACAQGGSVAIARALIAKGHDFKQKNQYGVNPLHIAAENGKTELVEYFLSQGAKIESTSLTGKTALHYARGGGHKDLEALLISKGASQAAPAFPVLKGDYLGQEKPGETPIMFAPGIVSGHHFGSEHSPAVFSPDLKEVYWTKQFRGPILFMKQKDGVWTEPEPAPFCSDFGDGEAIFSPDGSRLYFLSFRPLTPGGSNEKENMWYVERTPAGWSEAKPVSPLINAFDMHWLFSVSNKGTIYFASTHDGGAGLNDIYSSRLVDGKYETPKNLGEPINGPGIDHTPFISPDESYLIYVTSENSPDPRFMKFFISFRNQDGSWNKPVELDEKINSPGGGLCPAITPDGKYMFFIGRGDIYWVSADFIEKLRPVKK